MNVYLIGMPGSGKSEVCALLSHQLGVPGVDLDGEIEQDAGRSVASIFEEDGEIGFRRSEHAALSRMSARGPAVVACGGGVVLDPDNVRAMRATGKVVWLRASSQVLSGRVGFGADRPLLRSVEDLERLAVEREEAYRRAADIEVDAEAEVPEVVTRIVEALG